MLVKELIEKLQDLPENMKNMEIRKSIRIYSDYDTHNEDYPISEIKMGYKAKFIEIR